MEDDTKLRYHANHFTQLLSKIIHMGDVLTARDAYEVYLGECNLLEIETVDLVSLLNL